MSSKKEKKKILDDFKKINKYKESKKLKGYNVCFSDIETIIEDSQHVPVVVCLLRDEPMVYNSIDEFMSDVIKNHKKSIIYFHNFGRFDSTFILKWIASNNINLGEVSIIERNNIIYEIELVDRKICFRDSYLIMPLSLEKIGENFCTENKKSKFDYQNVTEIYKNNKELVIELCINDCLILKEGYNNFSNLIYQQFQINLYSQLTLPSLSFNIFKKMYYDVLNHPIAKNPFYEDEFIRRSYAGGISEVFKPHLINGFCYDVNSLYPFVMMNYKFPVGKGKFVKGEEIDINNFIGFIECEVNVDNELNYLTYRDKERGLITPTGKWTAVYFHEEVKFALELGYKIKFIKGFKYEKSDYIFRKFVKDLYKLRKESTNKSMNSIAKLILNSLYGRFGMKIFAEATKFINISQVRELKKNYIIKNVQYLGNNLYTVSVQKKSDNDKDLYKNSIDTETAVQIASAVTAYARLYMYKFKNIKGNECYYTDTDSIFVQNKIDESLVNDDIGKFKLEYEIKEGFFIAPKVYMIIMNESSNKVVVKGLKKSEYTTDQILNIFKSILTKTEASLKVDRENLFKRNLLKLITYVQKIELNLTFPFNKRIKIFENNVWIGTRAIKIKKL